jgi:heptosyltransferase-3
MQQCAVFSCLGLGDGLISLVLSHNLCLNGFLTTTFHPFLQGLQEWFPSTPIVPFPPQEEIGDQLAKFDRFFIMYERSSRMRAILEHCEKYYPEKTTVLNPIATPKTDYPYWENGRFDGTRPFVDNLYMFCRDLLKLAVVTKGNGVVIPQGILPRRYLKRVMIHPMSSRPGKNWPQEKFLRLADHLKKKGYRPVFALTEEEKKEWDLKEIESPSFANLSEVAAYVCESGYMVGNDSGIGHLASCFSLPTVTICRSPQALDFWRPAWSRGDVVGPYGWIPNIKGLRLRDEHWKKWVSVSRVLSSFLDLAHQSELT